MTENVFKVSARHGNVNLRVMRGHFATSHSHINYYIDVTMQKSRLSEAQAVAKEFVSFYTSTTIVDTILCLDGTEVIGTCLADELTRGNFTNMNAHRTIYIATPEHTTGSQIIFRDNTSQMITGKNVLVLAASVATGYTARAAIEAINYYGGYVAGVCSIFSTTNDCMGHPVRSIFNPNDLQDYFSCPSHECPQCRAGKKLDGLVNCFGYSKL